MITKDSFSKFYPAVWFSPSDGTITPVLDDTEIPTDRKNTIWIEPGDPEISTSRSLRRQRGKGLSEFQLIGYGKTHFENPVLPKKRR